MNLISGQFKDFSYLQRPNQENQRNNDFEIKESTTQIQSYSDCISTDITRPTTTEMTHSDVLIRAASPGMQSNPKYQFNNQ